MQNFSFLTNTYMYHSIIALNDNFCYLVLQLTELEKKEGVWGFKKIAFLAIKALHGKLLYTFPLM